MIKPLLAAALILTAAPAFAGPLETALFGNGVTDQVEHACFVRHYDDAHLKGHPKQNVTDMLLIVDGNPGEEGSVAYYSLGIGVKFRGVADELGLSGGCGNSEDGTALNCGIDCDGGIINVKLRDADTVLVEIPDGARTWDPEDESEPDPKAAFGEDDKVFRLNRADLKSCASIIWDEDLKAKVTAGG